jgi:DUF4097 and DUF4098 domain-containing protein YvlB
MRKLTIAVLAVAGTVLFAGAACVATVSGFSASLNSKAQRDETRTLELESGDLVKVELEHGDVDVRTTDSTPRVVARWSAAGRDDAEAKAILDRYQLEIVREAGTVRVRAVGEPLHVSAGWGNMSIGASVDLELELPHGTPIDARSGSGNLTAVGPLGSSVAKSDYGNIELRSITGNVEARTSSGTVRVNDVRGELVVVRSDYGDVRVENAEARELRLKSGSGRVALSNAKGDASLESDYGSIDVEGVDGNVRAATSSGNVRLDARGEGKFTLESDYGEVATRGGRGQIEAKSDSGRVSISGFQGRVRAHSGYGDVALEGVFDAVQATTSSGSVRIVARENSRVAEGWKLESDYGDVELTAPSDLACLLDARTDYGKVRSDFPVLVEAGDRDDKGLTGAIGGGGATLLLATSNGNVRLRKLIP